MTLRQHLRDLFALTKIRITVVAAFTGYTGIAVHDFVRGTAHATSWSAIWPCLLALCLLGGAANTLNQVFEKDKDALMERTRLRRPVAAGRMSVRTAVWLAIAQFAGSIGILLGVYDAWLAAGLTLFTLLYYSFFYTLYLKPRHWLNIVVGGVPGSMGPVISWAAFGHDVSWEPLVLFSIIFLWTPPHVWALAIKLKEDYARAGIPMLPVVKGVDETTRQIFWYTVVLVIGTLALPMCTSFWPIWDKAPVYGALATVLGGVFLAWAFIVWKRRPVLPTMPLFRFSIIYICALFVGLIVDSFRGTP